VANAVLFLAFGRIQLYYRYPILLVDGGYNRPLGSAFVNNPLTVR